MGSNLTNPVAMQQAYYTATAGWYEKSHEAEGSGEPRHVDLIISMLRMLKVRSVLDVGTASGRTLRTLKAAIPELFMCGIEPVAALLDEAVSTGNSGSGAIVQGMGDALPFADNSFDAVCEFAILHHVAEPQVVVGEMLRVAKRVVLISDSNRFGQGPMFLRLVKLLLYKLRLWGIFNYLRTSGKKYQITEGDGLAYSYSVYDNYDQIAKWADRIFVISSERTTSGSWVHPLLTSGGVILCAVRDR